MTFWETIQRGEYVMFAIAVLFIIIICIWWARAANLSAQKKKYQALMERVRDLLMEGDTENARQICEVSTTSGARILAAGIVHIGRPMTEVKSAMKDVSKIEKNRMGRGQRWLMTIAVISPLIGLGGTLTGIIDRLRDLGAAGSGIDISAVCGAIAPTVVTTVAGLGVGVFSLIALACLEGTADKAARNLDELEIEFTNLLNEPS